MQDEKSPCYDCDIHLQKLDKKDECLPCGTCRLRLDYAEHIYGMPARAHVHQDIYELYADGVKMFAVFDDGLRISDIAYMR